MPRIEFYIISKTGLMLHKFSVKKTQDDNKDQLVSGLLSAINSFAADIGWASGVSMIRSGSIEARYSQGEFVFGILIVDYYKPGIADSESALDAFASDITERFESVYKKELEEAKQSNRYNITLFQDFGKQIDEIILENNDQIAEIYQQQILIQSIYADVPQEIILPLLHRLKSGENILDELPDLILEYPIMLKAIEKTNMDYEPVWTIFKVPLLKKES
ncbi:MAG: hypothetical protein JW776_06870 [Candidatus Lokiarchaeota archaeon]|nr:hypothetical protein [Candidatus Lokiarchaeota archaeon]